MQADKNIEALKDVLDLEPGELFRDGEQGETDTKTEDPNNQCGHPCSEESKSLECDGGDVVMTKKQPTKAPLFECTFHVETIRLVSSIALFIVFLLGFVITTYSDINERHPPEETVIYQAFGFNHACNLVDHNPARMVAAILIPLYCFPMVIYVSLFHFRLVKSVQDGRVPKWLLIYSRFATPYSILAFSQLHLWFVNNPDDDYGFVAHYVPYLMFQLALSCTLILNVQYLIYTDKVPFRSIIKPWMAWAYQIFFLILLVLSMMIVFGAIVGDDPVIDPKGNDTHTVIAQVISNVFAFFVIVMPIVFSAAERKNGDVNIITFG